LDQKRKICFIIKKNKKLIPKKFFIAGCQRSGTTLLRLILESHRDIVCKDEPGCYQILSDNRKLDEFVNGISEKKWVGFKIPRFAEQLTHKMIYDYGAPNISAPFVNFYRREPIIFIVRDVRDVICSMLELKADKKPWVKQWGIPITNYWIDNSVEFRKQFQSEISKIQTSKDIDIATCAFFWKYKNFSYYKYLDQKFPMIMIKYEDLVNNPKDIISSIISFLSLEWDDMLMEHHLLQHPETDPNGMAIGNTNSKKPVSSFHVGRYHNELTENQLQEIYSISGDFMKSFGYNM
jgi:hypothetical protein